MIAAMWVTDKKFTHTFESLFRKAEAEAPRVAEVVETILGESDRPQLALVNQF